MTETMGPSQVDCPDRIIRLLSPVEEIPDPSYAAEWRSNVATAKERRRTARKPFESFQQGDTVRLPYSVQFSKAAFPPTLHLPRLSRSHADLHTNIQSLSSLPPLANHPGGSHRRRRRGVIDFSIFQRLSGDEQGEAPAINGRPECSTSTTSSPITATCSRRR